MKRNVGQMDRRARAVVGVVVIVLGLYFKSWWGAIGLVPLLTSLMGLCPAYLAFGISTCEKPDGHA